MLFEILALVLGVIFLILINLLRNVLSLTFYNYTLDLLPKNFQPPSSWNDLYVEAKNELEHIGFVHIGWISIQSNSPKNSEIYSVASIFSNEAHSSQVLVMPPLSIDRANNLSIGYVSWLENNTVLSSQAFDFSNELVADEESFFAQTLTVTGISQQWQQHLNWRNQFALKSDNDACKIQHLLKSFNFLFSDTDRLLRGKKVWQDKKGIIRPTFRFALKIIKTARYYNKQIKPDTALVPTDRLIDISSFTKQTQKLLSLSSFWQWRIFGVSCLLFIALGYVFFGLTIAFLLFVTIVIHESGHYLTMRLFGYKNTQMIALPLLGGVTTGVKEEENPTQRAWINIMGPLPGIVLGWGLLIIYVFYKTELNNLYLDEWLLYGVIILLIINYLNLLPITPLDGGNILQCLLPPRWFSVRIILIILGCLLAAYIAWVFNIYIIVIISLLQLFFILPALLNERKIINKIIKNTDFVESNKQQKLHFIFQTLIENTTPEKGIMGRTIMRQAYSLLEIFTQHPIKKIQQLILGSIYIGLFAIPFLILGYSNNLVGYISYKITPEVQAQLDQVKNRTEIANTLTLESLLETKLKDKLVAPALASEIMATETRLTHPLPNELKKLYSHSNGIPQLGILPIEQIVLSSQWSGWDDLFESQENLTIIPIDDNAPEEIFTKSSLNWIYIGKSYQNEYLFYRLNPLQEKQGRVLYCYDLVCVEYKSLDERLKEIWIYHSLIDE